MQFKRYDCYFANWKFHLSDLSLPIVPKTIISVSPYSSQILEYVLKYPFIEVSENNSRPTDYWWITQILHFTSVRLQNNQFNYFTKYRKGKWKLLPKIEEITVGQAHANTQKLNQNISTGRLYQSEESKCLWTHDTLESHAIFVVCSHTFALFWLRKRAVSVKIFWLTFRVFCGPVLQWSIQFLVRVFTVLSLISWK